jgi:DNA polymerase II small subunit
MVLVDDETVGIVGKFSRDDNSTSGIVFADEVLRPDIVQHLKRRSGTKGEIAAFISDIHAGSRHFLSRDWRRMVRWLNGEDSGSLDPGIAGRVKYLVVAGDLVDGIGIYPDQDKDLDIPDISRQYEMLAGILSEVPSHIHIILVPGNHDAVRLAEPQPALPREFTECFSNERIHFMTNPAYFSLSGVSVTAYHGKSIDDMVQLYKDVTYENPLEGMKEMLRSRHLGLTYGMRNQLSPEDRDMLILREVPDILVTGHVHRYGISDFRGVCMVQAGTWQSQTAFQRMMNFKPQPSRMALIDLSNWETNTWDVNGNVT